ncbi:MAG: hypothetical protein N3A59_08785 [Thermodesulfovibrionales bacterium]|nr:hypothetical protein [Thermodesulfovibrionales bacterium]
MNVQCLDLHTHGLDGFDTHCSTPEDILTIAKLHGKTGVSEIILTIYPSSIKQMRQEMELIRRSIELQHKSFKNDRELSSSDYTTAKIRGIHLEGPFLNKKRGGALNSNFFLEPSEYLLEKLLDGFEDLVKIITIAPELNNSLKVIKKIVNLGIKANMGHSDATYKDALDGYNHGAKGVTHIFNAMRGFHHREPAIVGFALLNPDTYIEVIADLNHLHPLTLKLIFSLKKKDKIILISDSVKETSLSNCYSKPIKDSEERLLGGSMTITQAAKKLIKIGFDEETVIKAITENPQRYLSQ